MGCAWAQKKDEGVCGTHPDEDEEKNKIKHVKSWWI